MVLHVATDPLLHRGQQRLADVVVEAAVQGHRSHQFDVAAGVEVLFLPAPQQQRGVEQLIGDDGSGARPITRSTSAMLPAARSASAMMSVAI
jgi:hypothetical protein